MPDLSPHYADLELSPSEMASLPETVLASLLFQAAIPSEDIAHILATRQRVSPLPPSILQSVAHHQLNRILLQHVLLPRISFTQPRCLVPLAKRTIVLILLPRKQMKEMLPLCLIALLLVIQTLSHCTHKKLGCQNQLKPWMHTLFIQTRQ